MGYTLDITRDPNRTGKPGRPLMLEDWFNLIEHDNELQFAPSADPRKSPPRNAEWIRHPGSFREPSELLFQWKAGTITCTYPDEAQIIKMVRISRILKATVIGETGERYDLDESGKLVVEDKCPVPPSPATYGVGAQPCSNFLKAVREKAPTSGLVFYNWYLGLLTAINAVRHQDGRSLISFTLNAEIIREDQVFLTQYCTEHPERMFHQAALTLLQMRVARCPP